MSRCPKDEPTTKNLVAKKLFPFPKKIAKNLLGGGLGHRRVNNALGHRRVNDARKPFLKYRCFQLTFAVAPSNISRNIEDRDKLGRTAL